jgi:hypothetical protein
MMVISSGGKSRSGLGAIPLAACIQSLAMLAVKYSTERVKLMVRKNVLPTWINGAGEKGRQIKSSSNGTTDHSYR